MKTDPNGTLLPWEIVDPITGLTLVYLHSRAECEDWFEENGDAFDLYRDGVLVSGHEERTMPGGFDNSLATTGDADCGL